MLDFLNQNPWVILLIPIFLFSLSVHEFAHALAANYAGDMLATYKGRLTLNPIAHIDPVGSVIVPLMLLLSTGSIFGWAKPVPVNPMRYDKPWWEVVVSGAGPASNFLLAFIAWVALVICYKFDLFQYDPKNVAQILITLFINLNILLGFFNLLPLPPLDGSHILCYYIYDTDWGKKVVVFLHQFGFILFILFLITPLSRFFFGFVSSVTEFSVDLAIKLAT